MKKHIILLLLAFAGQLVASNTPLLVDGTSGAVANPLFFSSTYNQAHFRTAVGYSGTNSIPAFNASGTPISLTGTNSPRVVGFSGSAAPTTFSTSGAGAVMFNNGAAATNLLITGTNEIDGKVIGIREEAGNITYTGTNNYGSLQVDGTSVGVTTGIIDTNGSGNLLDLQNGTLSSAGGIIIRFGSSSALVDGGNGDILQWDISGVRIAAPLQDLNASGNTLDLQNGSIGTAGGQVMDFVNSKLDSVAAGVYSVDWSNLILTAGDWSLDGNKLISVADPASAQDAATKNYVDTTSANAVKLAKISAVYSGTGTLNAAALTALTALNVDITVVGVTTSGKYSYSVGSGTSVPTGLLNMGEPFVIATGTVRAQFFNANAVSTVTGTTTLWIHAFQLP